MISYQIMDTENGHILVQRARLAVPGQTAPEWMITINSSQNVRLTSAQARELARALLALTETIRDEEKEIRVALRGRSGSP